MVKNSALGNILLGVLSVSVIVLCLGAAYKTQVPEPQKHAKGGKRMKLVSPEFKNREYIPGKFSCEGKDVNPALVIGNIPAGAKSLALILDDPDAPSGTFVHWVLYDIAVSTLIAENSTPGTRGINSAGELGYSGPCPPPGKPHRYFFKIYALKSHLGLPEGADKDGLEKAMKDKIIGSAELIGLYKR